MYMLSMNARGPVPGGVSPRPPYTASEVDGLAGYGKRRGCHGHGDAVVDDEKAGLIPLQRTPSDVILESFSLSPLNGSKQERKTNKQTYN